MFRRNNTSLCLQLLSPSPLALWQLLVTVCNVLTLGSIRFQEPRFPIQPITSKTPCLPSVPVDSLASASVIPFKLPAIYQNPSMTPSLPSWAKPLASSGSSSSSPFLAPCSFGCWKSQSIRLDVMNGITSSPFSLGRLPKLRSILWRWPASFQSLVLRFHFYLMVVQAWSLSRSQSASFYNFHAILVER